MKLQGLGIIFAIIILPVIIILSYYIQISVDTIALQTSYKSKLNSSTYDSMKAFEMNTANENLSTVADSLRSIIDASNSVFFDSLASNFGMSNANKSLFQAYVPAILYTLYDGYYIYAPTKQPEILTYQDWMLTSDKITWNTNPITNVTSADISYDEDKNVQILKSDVENNGGQPIYTPQGTFIYITKEGTYTSDLNQAKMKVDYVLKTYMPYSARYVHKEGGTTGDKTHDITINYTLDNYINIMGDINEVYYSKTGYLIDPDTVKTEDVTIAKVDPTAKDITREYLMSLNEDEAQEICLSGKYEITIKVKCKSKTSTGDYEYVTIKSNPRALDTNPSNSLNISGARADEIEKQLKSDYENWHNVSYGSARNSEEANKLLLRIQQEEAELANIRAVAYYVRNTIFSRWVYDNLKDIEAQDIQNQIISNTVNQYLASTGNNYENKSADVRTLFQVFDGDATKIFGDKSQDTDLESPFTNHKDGVIRNSIQYNLDLAFSAYTEMYSGNLSFQMPVIPDTEWERIINNVSIVSFMQGMPCGTKNFNSYSIINSANNELTVIPSEIYYIPTNNFNDETSYAHRVDCEEMPVGNSLGLTCLSPYISMKSNDVKYDGIYNKNNPRYEYSFRNLLDYSCIINKNLREKEYTIGGTQAEVQRLDPSKWSGDGYKNNRNAYYTGIAEQRQKLYKTNALTESCGYTYLSFTNASVRTNNSNGTDQIDISLAPSKTLADVKEFEFYFDTFQVSAAPSIVIGIKANGTSLELYGKDTAGNDIWEMERNYQHLSSGNGTNMTIRARCHGGNSEQGALIPISFSETAPSYLYGTCIGVKVIYK